MSLCQPNEKFSCGACCGLFNLKIDFNEYKNILQERTEVFHKTVDFSIRWTMPEYRKIRENKESNYPKKDDTIYNCPFLGYIDENRNRIGCMIHPFFTGDPKSQNFSFYGAGICQAYDCKNKEKDSANEWKKLFEEVAQNSVEYTRLASNHILINRIEKFFESKQIPLNLLFSTYRKFIKSVLVLEINSPNKYLTSFELEMESIFGREEEALMEYLENFDDEEILNNFKKVDQEKFPGST
ncbi:MAG: hypothetical protein KDK36_00130 [Leptospiraceae bacterium]|nr:hypothetical protein [Leptospiraceae bacterium]